jgi:hypothetical protein
MKGVRMNKNFWFFSSILAGLLLVAACAPSSGGQMSEAEQTLQAIYLEQTVAALSQAAQATATVEETPEPTPTTEIVHTVFPGEPGWVSQWWQDANSTNTAPQRRASGGDFFNQNLFERPFTAQNMDYRPDLDIIRVEISHNPTFYYIQLHLSGVNPANNMLSGFYGVEFDTDRDGRGDVLLWVRGDGNTEWNIDQVYVYQDLNNDVGASRAMLSDAVATGLDGYEHVLFSPEVLDDPDAAWKRVSPSDPKIIQLAIKKTMLGNAAAFLWSGWADDGIADPSLFDYNDAFTFSQAGSPIDGNAEYPLKGVYLVDNTCRLAFGFTPTGFEVGGCVLPTPTPTPTPVPPTATPEPTPTATQETIIT